MKKVISDKFRDGHFFHVATEQEHKASLRQSAGVDSSTHCLLQCCSHPGLSHRQIMNHKPTPMHKERVHIHAQGKEAGREQELNNWLLHLI